SLEENDIGFSTNVLTPCSIIFLATKAWVLVGVQTRQPSSRSLPSMSSTEEYDGTPYLSAISFALAASRSQIAARHPRSFSTLAWFLPQPPTPITATLVPSTIQESTSPHSHWHQQKQSWHTFRGCPWLPDLPFHLR